MTTEPSLLPGVAEAQSPPTIRCNAHAAIRKARRRALVRDLAQATLLFGVDLLFVRWSDARLPMISRATSLTIVGGANALLAADVWLRRRMPEWFARRVVATWSRSERERFRANGISEARRGA